MFGHGCPDFDCGLVGDRGLVDRGAGAGTGAADFEVEVGGAVVVGVVVAELCGPELAAGEAAAPAIPAAAPPAARAPRTTAALSMLVACI